MQDWQKQEKHLGAEEWRWGECSVTRSYGKLFVSYHNQRVPKVRNWTEFWEGSLPYGPITPEVLTKAEELLLAYLRNEVREMEEVINEMLLP